MRLQGNWLIYNFLVVLALVWGTSFILIKKGLLAFSPIQLASLRLSFAGLVLLPLLIRDIKKVQKKHVLGYVLVAIFGNLIPYFLFAVAETEVESAIIGALNGLTPFFTILLALVVFRTESTTRQWIGIGIGLIGALFLMTDGNLAVLSDFNSYGLFAILACVCYAISVNTIKAKLNDTSPVLAASFPLGLSMVIALPVAILSGSVQTTFNHVNGYESLLYILILGVVGTAVAIILFNRLVQMTTAVVASSVTYLIPVVAFFWGWWDGEHLVWENVLGLLLILSGVYLVKSK